MTFVQCAVLAGGLWASRVAWADASVEKININGYEIHLVDMKTSNRFGFTFSVPYGSADDQPNLFGRAHFFEHMFLRGSRRHPGRTAIDEAMSQYGYQYNASTGLAQTSYYATGGDDHGLEALDVLFGGLEHLELDPNAFTDEKSTVVEEIVFSAPNRPERALFALPFMVLPYPGHPARGQYSGDAATLEAMSVEDLRDLHESIYHSGNVRIAVMGNFSAGRITKEAVRAKLFDILPVKPARPAYRRRAVAPIFARDHRLDIVSENERTGRVFLPVAAHANLADVRVFLDAFTTSSEGSAESIAKKKLGWATQISSFLQRVGDQHFAVVDFELTKDGYAHRAEFVRWLLASLKAARHEAYPEEYFSETRRAYLQSHQRFGKSLPSLISAFGKWMAEGGHDSKLALDWPSYVADFTSTAARSGARALDYTGKVIAFMGPDASGATEVDQFARVRYATEEWTDAAPPVAAAQPEGVRVARVILPPSSNAPRLAGGDVHERIDQTDVIRSDRPAWTDRTVRLRFEFPTLTPLDKLSFGAWMNSVRQELAPELASLQADGTTVGLEQNVSGLTLSATGEHGDEIRALEWLITRLREVRADPRIFAQFVESQELSLRRGEDGFAGQLASGLLGELLSAFGTNRLELEKHLPELGLEEVDRVPAALFARAHRVLVIAGPTLEGEVESLLTRANALSPIAIARPPRPRTAPRADLRYVEGWRRAGQSGTGVARAYAGPPASAQAESAAFEVIADLMHEKVFPKTRPYGYVQSVSARATTAENVYAYFVGQAGDVENLPAIEHVWNEELARWSRGEVGADEIDAGRRGRLARLKREPATSAEAAGLLFSGLDFENDPFHRARAIPILESLRTGDFVEVADRYLSAARPSLTVTKGIGDSLGCDALLTARAEIRAQVL